MYKKMYNFYFFLEYRRTFAFEIYWPLASTIMQKITKDKSANLESILLYCIWFFRAYYYVHVLGFLVTYTYIYDFPF